MEPMQQDLWIWSAREVDPVYRWRMMIIMIMMAW